MNGICFGGSDWIFKNVAVLSPMSFEVISQMLVVPDHGRIRSITTLEKQE